ncbi:MAG: Gfo/Idh/MocA family oxidoreductase [Pseudomonadota bacterium]
MTQPIRIGLLGASRIAPAAIIEPTTGRDDFVVTAIAARSSERAAQFAREHRIETVFANYADLTSAANVDLVYNALPPAGHLEWTLAALAAGKHVLCEKPFAMNANEARVMVAVADDSRGALLEAFHYRFHPLFDRLLKQVRATEFGNIQRFDAHFNVAIPFVEGELRHVFELGGGALMDLGCYPLHWARTVFGFEPRIESAKATEGAPGIDLSMHAVLDFDGIEARISCDMSETVAPGASAQLCVYGENQTVTVENPIAPHHGHQLIVEAGDRKEAVSVPGRSTYSHQLDHVAEVIAGEATALTGGADAVANMQAIDRIYTAAGLQPRTSLHD